MAYASKYYDPVKRHEYYMKHRQLKGRQKKATSTAGLSEDGKAAAAEVKEKLMAEYKAAVKGLPRKSPKRQALKEAMNQKYAEELAKIREDSSLVKQPKEKVAKQKASKSKASGKQKASKQEAKSSKKEIDQTAVKKAVQAMQGQIDRLKEKIANLTPEQKGMVKESLQAIIDQLKAQQKKVKKSGVSAESKKLLKSAEKINATTD